MANDDQQAQIPLLYANALRVGITFSDIRLYFGEHMPPSPPDDLVPGQTVEMGASKQIDRLCVVITPDILPGIIDGLARGIEIYKSKFGALRSLPQPVQPPPKQ